MVCHSLSQLRVEIKGESHSVYESRPTEVAALIEHAAQNDR